MGTLGCIDDMLRRDKENRELRKRNKERLYEVRNRLLDVRVGRSDPDISVEQLEEVRKKTVEKEMWDKHQLFRGKLIFIGLVAVLLALGIMGWLWLFG